MRAPLMILLAGVLRVSAADATEPVVAGVTSTAAVLRYTAPDGGACRIEASESESFVPLAADVDAALFPGADLDSRPGSLAAGLTRVVVIGRRSMSYSGAQNPFLGTDGRRHSRALRADSVHFFRITCAAAEIARGSFRTANIMPGNTHGDPLPADPLRPGAYNWPEPDPADRNERLVDPATGASIRKLTVSRDSNPDNRNHWPDGGMFSLCSHLPEVSGGHTWYLCAIPSSYAATLLAVDVTSGDVRPLSRLIVPYLRLGNEARLACGYPLFDGSNPRRFYFVAFSRGVPRVVMGEWTGPLDASYPVGAELTASAAPVAWTDLTPGAGGLSALVAAFDARFNIRDAASFYYTAQGQQSGKLLISALAAQDADGWVLVFDPAGAGGIVAALPVWQSPGGRWCGLHSVATSGDRTWWVAMAVKALAGGSAPMAGPYRVRAGAIGQSDTVLAIGGPGDSIEPVSPSGPLMEAAPGDLFFIDRNGDGYYTAGTDEYVELISKDPVARTWTVRRAAAMASSPFYADSGLHPDLPSFATPAGSYIYAACRAQSLVTPYSATLWWNFEADPHGSRLVPPAVSGLKSPEVIEHIYTGAHEVNRDETGVMAGGPVRLPVAWSAWTLAGGVPGLDTESPAVALNARPDFEGASPPGYGNTYQQHPSYEQVNGPAEERRWFLDVMPLVAGTAVYGRSQRAGATASVYQVTETNLERERMATLASCGTRPLADISSPARGDRIGDETPYTYCVAREAGECRADSSPGDVYANCPGANVRLPGDPPSVVRCASTEITGDMVDLCIGDLWPYAHAVVQTGFAADSLRGERSRVITQAFDTYHTGIYANARATPDGGWAMFNSPVTGTSEAYMAKLPPLPDPDGVERDRHIAVRVPVAPPAAGSGAESAVVRFGYPENGPPEKFFCTSRQEACVKGAQPSWEFGFASGETAGVPCASGCEIVFPLLPGRIAWFQVEYRDPGGNPAGIVARGVAGESWSVVLGLPPVPAGRPPLPPRPRLAPSPSAPPSHPAR